MREEEGKERVRMGEMPEQNIGFCLLFYVSLCSHSGAAPEPSESRLIDATKPTRASRKEMPRGSSYVRRFCITPVPAEGGGLVNHAAREKKGARREERSSSRVLLAIRDVLFFKNFFFFFVTSCIYVLFLYRVKF